MTNAKRIRALLTATRYGNSLVHVEPFIAANVSFALLTDEDMVKQLRSGQAVMMSRARAQSIIDELEDEG